jgi:hypothetical protein
MDIGNLTGLEKPLVKLVEVCAQGVGAIARPWLIKREAKALLEAQSNLANAGLDVTGFELGSLKAQISARIDYQEAKRQANLQAITREALAALPPVVDEEAVDSDWIARFFSHAQDVSHADMQALWGRLLTGEVTRPGAFSLRTLDLVRNLSISEARLFANLCKFVFDEGWFIDPYPASFDGTKELVGGTKEDGFEAFYGRHGIPPGSLQILREAGLVLVEDDDNLAAIFFSPGAGSAAGHLGKELLRFSHPSLESWRLRFDVRELTRAGKELLSVLMPSTHDEMLDQLAGVARRLGLALHVDRDRSGATTAVQHGVAPDDRSPSAPARR